MKVMKNRMCHGLMLSFLLLASVGYAHTESETNAVAKSMLEFVLLSVNDNLDDVDYVLDGLLKIGFDDVFEVSKAAELVSAYTRLYLKTDGVKKPSRPCCRTICNAVTRPTATSMGNTRVRPRADGSGRRFFRCTGLTGTPRACWSLPGTSVPAA